MLTKIRAEVLRHINLFLKDDWVFTIRRDHQENKIQSFLVRNSVFDIARALDIELIVKRHNFDVGIVHGAFNAPWV